MWNFTNINEYVLQRLLNQTRVITHLLYNKDIYNRIADHRSGRIWDICFLNCSRANGPLARHIKLQVAHAPRMSETFSPPPRVSDPDMHHSTYVTYMSWCMPGSLPSDLLWSRWWGKRSRHSRHMRNPKFAYLVRGPLCTLLYTKNVEILVTTNDIKYMVGYNDPKFGYKIDIKEISRFTQQLDIRSYMVIYLYKWAT